jgi:DNA-cytosine methyltransferase
MKQKYKVLDLFSGLGGFSLGLERTGHFETVAFCDNDKFSKAILDKHWKGIKVYDDVREITKEKFKEDGIEFPDIITGGFPCQPFSVAGKQKGTGDDRHLWPEMFRIIKAFKPRFVIGENVRGIVNIQDGVVFETVCTNLEDEGYEVQPFNIPAAAVGAPHRRERIWFIAVREEPMVDSDNIRFEQHNETTETTSRRGTSATSQSTSNVGNSEYNGSPTSEIRRGNEKINGGTEERQNNSFEFERTSRSEDNGNVSENVADTENGRGQPSQSERWQGTERGSIDSRGIEREGQDLGTNVENSNNNGLEGRLTETRNETITGKESSFNGSEDTDNSSRRSDGGGDQSKSRIDGAVQGLRDGNEEELTRTTRVRGVHERTNISVGTIRENKNQEDDNRTLVQTRQSGVQSSVGGGLELNQTSLDNNQIRQGDDNSSLNRMETRDKDNVADTNDEGLRTRIGGSDNDHETESRIGGADGTRSTSDVERNNSTSTEIKGMDVANTDTRLGNGENEEIQSRGQTSISSSEGTNKKLADTNGEGLEGFGQSSRQLSKTFFATDSSEERQRTMDQGWWSVEPNVGRVAHGVSGRVHRLKGLGNSIVPQIVEEIGYAIVKAMK